MSTVGSSLTSGTGICHAVDGGREQPDIMEVEERPVSVAESATPALPSEARAIGASKTMRLRSDVAPEPETTSEGGVENPRVELPSEAEMVRRLVILCVGDQGPPTESSGRVPGLKATHELIRRAVLVVFRFFRERKSEIKWVTELAQLDKMDGLAYLLADLLRGELLLEEANLIGKRAHKRVATDVPKREKELKEQAKSDRSYARLRVTRGQLDAMELDDAIAEIDRCHDEAIAALWQEEYKNLGLPAENTVVVQSRAPPLDKERNKLMRLLADTIKEADETAKIKRASLDELSPIIDGAKAKLHRLMQRQPPKRKGKVTVEFIEKQQQFMDDIRAARDRYAAMVQLLRRRRRSSMTPLRRAIVRIGCCWRCERQRRRRPTLAPAGRSYTGVAHTGVR